MIKYVFVISPATLRHLSKMFVNTLLVYFIAMENGYYKVQYIKKEIFIEISLVDLSRVYFCSVVMEWKKGFSFILTNAKRCIMMFIQWLMIIDTHIPMYTITELNHFRDQRYTL